ncbi:integrase catalytic region [Vibrio ichthyoenteri ATCC 700023]|uniref:Integrase catalytic region n=1 Tax=Vibrio ichthyoenteri ATCC 700023 TaxID=870968 RepID=F9RZN5_9VIBR|nr:DDE-type integrase/transposase/recombinase [Vibrio ichthyoenteri]EGU44694.1 integrase catalytic region [Vibrio ichthyoenteri ATCC 700023]
MNDWVSALDIATATKISRRNINIRAGKENWPKRERQGRGGGFEYLLTSLPGEMQGHLAKFLAERAAKDNPTFRLGSLIGNKHKQKDGNNEVKQQMCKEQALIDFNQLQGNAKKRAEARLQICFAYKQFIVPFSANKQIAVGDDEFVTRYNDRSLQLPEQVRIQVKQLSRASLKRWVSALNSNGPVALAGNYKPDRKHLIDQDESLKAFCRGLVWHKPDIQATNLHEALRGQIGLGKIDTELPSLSSVRRWLETFKREFKLALHQMASPDDFKNRKQVAWGNACESITRINEMWELDSTPSDVMLMDGRHSIIGAIDIYSRRPIVIVHPTSSAEAVCILMRKAILEFGVPESVKTDNGKDYTSLRVMSVLDALNIKQVLTKPFAGDEKPHIERFFRTWAHGISTLLPGYAGHNVAKRQELRSRRSFAEQILSRRKDKDLEGKLRISKGGDVDVALTGKELQAIIDDWINHHYMHKQHRSIKCTPTEKWQSKRSTIRTISDDRALDILLSPVPAASGRSAGMRVANKDAGLVVEGISYFAPELGALIGDSLFCSWDPHDVGQLYVFEQGSMAFVCVAKNPELVGQNISLSQLSKEAQRQQNERLAQQRKELKKASRKVGVGEVARDVLDAAKIRNSSVLGLPHIRKEHETTAVQSAQQAINKPSKPRLDRSEFERRRKEQIQMDQAFKAQQAKPRFASQIEEFTYYLRQQDFRLLTEEEIMTMDRFRKLQPDAAKMAERLKAGTEAPERKVKR